MKYLITYHSATGTTAAIAEELAQALRTRGLQVDLMPLEQANDLSGYSHVVVGAPINGMQWVPPAQEYLREHAEKLQDVELSIFAVSYVMPSGWKFWRRIVGRGIDSLATESGAVRSAIFRGRIDRPLPAPLRILFGIPAATPLDLRDPAETAAWAEQL